MEPTMPRWRPRTAALPVCVLAVACAWLLMLATPARADNGPHDATVNSGAAGLTADSCAGCHRAHVAQGPALINAATEVDLCLSCHGSAVAGATTNVIDGVLAGSGRGIKGGGFVNALMDTAWDGAGASRASTSSHLFDGTSSATVWGSGAVGSGAGQAGSVLSCVSCHNPHGNGTYRALRPLPTGSVAASGIAVSDEATKVYTVTSTQNRYFGEVYGGGDYLKQYEYVEWCARCHTRYDTGESGSGSTDSGDPIFRFRHMTRYTTWIDCGLCHGGSGGINATDRFGVGWEIAHEAVCQNCHVAHGSSARMGSISGNVAWPDGSTSATDDGRSSLLRLDYRGICLGCHDPWR
jgi:predicted CXXCH cytochrome family protein